MREMMQLCGRLERESHHLSLPVIQVDLSRLQETTQLLLEIQHQDQKKEEVGVSWHRVGTWY